MWVKAVTIMRHDADGNLMSTNVWRRATTAVRDRYERTAFAQYGAGLHTDCDDCGTAPADVVIPAPRRMQTADEHARSTAI